MARRNRNNNASVLSQPNNSIVDYLYFQHEPAAKTSRRTRRLVRDSMRRAERNL